MADPRLQKQQSFSKILKNVMSSIGADDDDITTGSLAALQFKWVFEVAWEVANKVGGIYTVIRSKAKESTEELGDRYCLFGPLNQNCVNMEVDITEQAHPIIRKTIDSMKEQGLKVIYGRWLIDGYPNVVLFDIASGAPRLDEWKNELWSSCHIGVPWHDRESNDAIILGAMFAHFFGEFVHQYELASSRPMVVCHFHEWMAGIGLLYCRTRKLPCATVFTTHATLLGRFLCAGHTDFYNNLPYFELDKEAGNRGIYHRYCMERAAAHVAHVFTTVSDITGIEATHLLHRPPDVITPNGLNVKKFAALHEFQNLHAVNKDKIADFVRGHFHGYYDFDMDKTLFFFTAGRYEFSNKGADMFIESLARLNHYMQKAKSDMTVVAFLIFPTRTNNFNVESLRGQAIAKQLKDTVASVQKEIGKRLFEICLRGVIPSGHDILVQEDIVKLKRCIYSANRHTMPPVCTHNVVDDSVDPVLCKIRACNLFNDRHDRVKVIFHPEFLSSVNPLFGMDYEDFVRGCHLGVFPSYYEPWGYTPAECTVMGIPNVSTNLSGYGCFMERYISEPQAYGIYVVDRRFKSPDESSSQLAQMMYDFTTLTRRQRIIQRNRTERLSEMLDWKNLGVHYRMARQKALQMLYPNTVAEFSEQMATRTGQLSNPQSKAPSPHDSDNEEDEDDLDAHLVDPEERSRRSTPSHTPRSRSPDRDAPNGVDSGVDALSPVRDRSAGSSPTPTFSITSPESPRSQVADEQTV